jgi:septum formation protein
MESLKKFNIILASKSPRRQQLLKDLGLEFTVEVTDADESYPDGLSMQEIPVFLAELKASEFSRELGDSDLLITADTIVWLDGEVLGKPADKNDAIHMLRKLSNNEHQVVTGVCLKSKNKQKSFYAVSNVAFKELSDDEINYYIDHYQPYDKAGAYGIQEWIGYIGITHIEGSFFNVMGLPIQKLYTELLKF